MPSQHLVEMVSVGRPDRAELRAATMVLAAVFAACLFGIYTRPVGFLASVWPANAIMLGLLVRVPAAARPLGWVAGAVAYLAADLLTGSSLLKAVLLNGANLAGIGSAYLLYRRLPVETVRLRQPVSVFYLILAAGIGAAVAGAVGGVVNPILFDGPVLEGWAFWFAAEFVNYVAILPVILSAPPLAEILATRLTARLRSILPAAALALSCLAATLIGGPGAIAFPVPALLWCGLSYQVFPTTILTLLFGLWSLVVIAGEYAAASAIGYEGMALISVRLGASLLTLAPITLSSVMQSRNELLAKLRHLASFDQLTGASNRNAFLDEAQSRIDSGRVPYAVLMIDLDHFKAVNDRYGHAVGDSVLVGFAARIRGCMRPGDLFGRLGGEEFALVVGDCAPAAAVHVAERIREAVAGEPVSVCGGRAVPLTTSIGLVAVTEPGAGSIDDLLARADAALYRAKAGGRDRWELDEPRRVGLAG